MLILYFYLAKYISSSYFWDWKKSAKFRNLVCKRLHYRLRFRWIIFWKLISYLDQSIGRNHSWDHSVYMVYWYPITKYISTAIFIFFFLTNTSPFSPLFSITVETVVRSSVMPVRTMNCLCLLRQSLFVSVIPAMQYLYRGALLMCPKILLQVIYQFLVFS